MGMYNCRPKTLPRRRSTPTTRPCSPDGWTTSSRRDTQRKTGGYMPAGIKPRRTMTRCGRKWQRQCSSNAARVHTGGRGGSLGTAWRSVPGARLRDRGTHMPTWPTSRQPSRHRGGATTGFARASNSKHKGGQEGGAARTAWKAVSRARKQEQRAWQQANVLRASQMDWRAKRTLDHRNSRQGWEHHLLDDIRWQDKLKRHLESIFLRAPQSSTAARLQDTRAALSKACKQH